MKKPPGKKIGSRLKMVQRTLGKQKMTKTRLCKTFPGQPRIPPDYISAHFEALSEVLWEVVGSQTSQSTNKSATKVYRLRLRARIDMLHIY